MMNIATSTPYDAMPVGAVLPYAADMTVFVNMQALALAGWMPCDGSLLPTDQYADLYNAIGTTHGGEVIGGKVVRFRSPDMRGLYARGVDNAAGRDPDALTRIAHNEGGATGDACGSFEDLATAAPHNPFTSDSQGAHSHTLANITTRNHYAYGGNGDAKAHTNSGGNTVSVSAGNHGHAIIAGGDSETRPVSLCLSWIIRFQVATS